MTFLTMLLVGMLGAFIDFIIFVVVMAIIFICKGLRLRREEKHAKELQEAIAAVMNQKAPEK